MKGLVKPLLKDNETEGDGYYVTCKSCKYFHYSHDKAAFVARFGDLGAATTECPNCRDPIEGRRKRMYLRPRMFFYDAPENASHEQSPPRASLIAGTMASYVPELVDAAITPVARAFEARLVPNASVFFANQGRSPRGFRFERDRRYVVNVSEKAEAPRGFYADLAFILKTDVYELCESMQGGLLSAWLSDPVRGPSIRTALHLGTAIALEVDTRDVGIDILARADRRKSLTFFDTAPGGSGTVRQLFEDPTKLKAVIHAALTVVRSCRCRESTACYDCLLRFDNQQDHADLSRGAALDSLNFLDEALGRSADASSVD